MKIGLLSDTHGWLDPRVVNFFKGCDEIWHAGDVGSLEVLHQLEKLATVRGVKGNIDDYKIGLALKESCFFEVESLKVCMIHIGGYPGHYTTAAKSLIQLHQPGLFISGHSHILKVMNDPLYNLLHMNPGAAGKQGLHQVRTALRFTVEKGLPGNLELFEIPRHS